MDEKNREELQQGVESSEVEELSETDLESIAGGTEADVALDGGCESGWCCTS